MHTNYNSTNVVRTIEDILGVNYLGSTTRTLFRCRTCSSSNLTFSRYTAPIPGILCQPPVNPDLVPECNNPGNRPITAAIKSLHDGAWWAQATKGFNFNHPDMINSELFNRILWRGIIGDDKPYPEPGHQLGMTEAKVDRD